MNPQPKPQKESSDKYAISKCDSLLYQCLLRRDKVCQKCGSRDNLDQDTAVRLEAELKRVEGK